MERLENMQPAAKSSQEISCPTPRILRWGPYPQDRGVFGGGIGGYARYNSQALRSQLTHQATIIPLSMTAPRFAQPFLRKLELPFRLIEDVVRITSALLTKRPALVHITALYWRSIYREAFAAWLAGLLNIPVLYDIRAGTFGEFLERCDPISRALAIRLLRTADVVAAQGEVISRGLAEEYGRHVEWIPNCFLKKDLDDLQPAQLSKPKGVEPLRLAYLGYVMAEKGVDVLLEAAQQLSRDHPVKVTLIGEIAPSFHEVLDSFRRMETTSFSVVTTGRLELSDALQILRQQHLFVFLSRFFGEGHPNAVNEAMAVGLPIVTTRNGFLTDVVTKECGVIVDDPKNARELQDVLRHLIQDWETVVSMGKSARERIENVFSDDVVLSRTIEIYRSLGSQQARVSWERS